MIIESDKKCFPGCKLIGNTGFIAHILGCPRSKEISKWLKVYKILEELGKSLGHTKAEIDEHYLWVRNKYESKYESKEK